MFHRLLRFEPQCLSYLTFEEEILPCILFIIIMYLNFVFSDVISNKKFKNNNQFTPPNPIKHLVQRSPKPPVVRAPE